MSIAAPVANSSAPPSVLDLSSHLVSADPTPVITQPIIEQVADAAPTAVEILQAAAIEPTLAELGLVAYTPVGLIQKLLEIMHMDLGLPWWGAIAVGKYKSRKPSHRHSGRVMKAGYIGIWGWYFCSANIVSCISTSHLCFCQSFTPHIGTVIARLAVFPVIVKGQREAAKMNNVMPEMTKLTNRMNEAKRGGNKFDCKLSLLFPKCVSLFAHDTDTVHVCALSEMSFCFSCCSCQSLFWHELVPEEARCESSPWLPGSFGAGQFYLLK